MSETSNPGAGRPPARAVLCFQKVIGIIPFGGVLDQDEVKVQRPVSVPERLGPVQRSRTVLEWFSIKQGDMTMRGTVRLGTIGLAIGLMFGVASTAATANMIPVDKKDAFPHSVHGDAMMKKTDLKKFDGKHKFKNFGQFVSKTAPHGPPDPIPFGQKVRKLVPKGPPDPFKKKKDHVKDPSFKHPPVKDPSFKHPPVKDHNGNDHANHVSTIPEPATWIMMIAGFGVVAWRLRHRGQHGFGSIPAHA